MSFPIAAWRLSWPSCTCSLLIWGKNYNFLFWDLVSLLLDSVSEPLFSRHLGSILLVLFWSALIVTIGWSLRDLLISRNSCFATFYFPLLRFDVPLYMLQLSKFYGYLLISCSRSPFPFVLHGVFDLFSNDMRFVGRVRHFEIIDLLIDCRSIASEVIAGDVA